MTKIKFGVQIVVGSIVVCKEFIFPLWMEGNKTKLTKGDISLILKLYDAQQFTRKLEIMEKYTWVAENYPVQILLKFYVEKDGGSVETSEERLIDFNFSRNTIGMEDIKSMILLNFPYEMVHKLIWKIKQFDPPHSQEEEQEVESRNIAPAIEEKRAGEGKGVYVVLSFRERQRLDLYAQITGLTKKCIISNLIKTLPASAEKENV